MKVDLRCGTCNRKLATAREPYDLIIKCPRCKGMNHLKAQSLQTRAPVSAVAGELNANPNHQMDGR